MDITQSIIEAVSKMKKGRPSTKSELDKIYANVKKTVKGGRGPSNKNKILDLINDRIIAVEKQSGELSRADIEKLFKKDLETYKKVSSKPKKEKVVKEKVIKPKKEKVVKEKVVKPKKEKVVKEKVIKPKKEPKPKAVRFVKEEVVHLPANVAPIPVVVENPFTHKKNVVLEVDDSQCMPISEPDKPFVSLDKRPSVPIGPAPLQHEPLLKKPKLSRSTNKQLTHSDKNPPILFKLNRGYGIIHLSEKLETRYL